jgi:hypothetical protein
MMSSLPLISPKLACRTRYSDTFLSPGIAPKPVVQWAEMRAGNPSNRTKNLIQNYGKIAVGMTIKTQDAIRFPCEDFLSFDMCGPLGNLGTRKLDSKRYYFLPSAWPEKSRRV